jgi:hypothetical protein
MDPAVLQGSATRPAAQRAGDDAARLQALAIALRSPATTWHGGLDWSQARNAHETNTPSQMEAALRSDANWLEGDVRESRSGALVMAHDPHDVGRGLTLEQWLSIGAASDRGVKVELKEPRIFDGYVAAIRQSGIKPERLILNVPVAGAPGRPVLSDAQLLELRRSVPGATINLSPTNQHRFTAHVTDELARTARLVGGPVMFPMQWDLLDDATIAALRPHGHVATWASRSWGTPRDPVSEQLALRERGVDGMIDLGGPTGLGQRVFATTARALGAVFGRQAVMDARDAVLALVR